MNKNYTRKGYLIENDTPTKEITCIVKGEMSDGSKVWNEINPETREIINETDLMLYVSGKHSFFVEM